MKDFENIAKDNPSQTFMENTFLVILEYILIDGMDNALCHLSDVSEEDVKMFPHVMKALKEKGILK